MRVRDVMSVNVTTVGPATPVIEIARTMLQRGIGGIPVVHDGVLVGMVCRSDILPFEDDPDRGLRTAADVMSKDVLAINETMTVGQAARALASRGFKRAPVVRGDALVGLVGESDLLRPYLRTDREIGTDIEEVLRAPALGNHGSAVRFSVEDGNVLLEGIVRGEAQRSLIVRSVRSIEGVAAVTDRTRLEHEQVDA